MSTERFVVAGDGLTLHCVLDGEPSDRTPVLCLPGLTRTNRDFEHVTEAWAADRLVAAVSLRGRGRSGVDPTGASYALDTYVDDVIAVLDDIGIDRAVLIGTSLGGLLALWTAYRHPTRVAGLVLNDIGPELQQEGLDRIRSYAGKLPPVADWDEAVAQTRALGRADFPDWGDDEWAYATRLRYRETPDRRVVLDHDPVVAAGRLATDDPWAVFAAVAEHPMLLVRGALTDLLAPATVAQMQAFHSGLEVVEVPNRGHAPTLGEPVAADAVRRFLSHH